MLSNDSSIVVGHNLDQEFYTPGMIHINRRGEDKRSVSSIELSLTDTPTPILNWTSKFGSVTFSLLGQGLPDGGMNEAGLAVNEMALVESDYPFSDTLPTMLAHQWIQYQLDMFANVKEVIQNLPKINVQPMGTFTPASWANYHAFVSDSSGDFAIIEFLEKSIVVHRGEAAPVPVLCNSPYDKELKRLQGCQSLWSKIRRWLNRKPYMRFAIAAEALEEYNLYETQSPTEFCFELLSSLQFDQTKQWSIVYDVENFRVSFRTVSHPDIKFLNFSDLDFSPEADYRILPSIDMDGVGDVSDKLVVHSMEADKEIIETFMTSMVQFFITNNQLSCDADGYLLKYHDFNLQYLIDRAVEISQKTMR
jgi:penicillin V acylase-like amidase (Ntn superfamily)